MSDPNSRIRFSLLPPPPWLILESRDGPNLEENIPVFQRFGSSPRATTQPGATSGSRMIQTFPVDPEPIYPAGTRVELGGSTSIPTEFPAPTSNFPSPAEPGGGFLGFLPFLLLPDSRFSLFSRLRSRPAATDTCSTWSISCSTERT